MHEDYYGPVPKNSAIGSYPGIRCKQNPEAEARRAFLFRDSDPPHWKPTGAPAAFPPDPPATPPPRYPLELREVTRPRKVRAKPYLPYHTGKDGEKVMGTTYFFRCNLRDRMGLMQMTTVNTRTGTYQDALEVMMDRIDLSDRMEEK